MAELDKVLYIVVIVDDEDKKEKDGKESFRYTRPVLQSTLQLMGCKARHAFKISKRVFQVMRNRSSVGSKSEISVSDISIANERQGAALLTSCRTGKTKVGGGLILQKDDGSKCLPSELYKMRTTVIIKRETFLDVVCDALAEYKYVGPNQRADLILACRIRERKESVTVLLCGTSGCGKSTLSSLLGSRLGITTVLSTDSIRHMMRSFVNEKQNPLLWASTYHAGEFLDPVAVAEAKARKKAKKMAGIQLSISKDDISDNISTAKSGKQVVDVISTAKSGKQVVDVVSTSNELISPKQMTIEGFKAQSEMVIDSLDRLITTWEERKESVIVEGVHLSLNFVMGLMKKHPSIIPFMIHITNEDKHLERFAVRAKYMTLDPAKNKYAKYIRNIRTIQEYLCNRADIHLVPKINNTNVDKSVAAIHATVFSCMRRREAGEPLYDPSTNTVGLVYDEYRNQCAANSLSSKGMFQLIQRKGSSRHLMALLNMDGSVAKAWPVHSISSNGKHIASSGADNDIGTPMYGPLQIGKAEPVNLQFGHFGISAWPSDTGGTSHASSFDESIADWNGTEAGSRYHSSCCSSPRLSDGPSKELKEEQSMSGSDEDDDAPELGSEDLSDDETRHTLEDLEGSVDEEATRSDEDYDDLAIEDIRENGYCTDDENDLMHEGFPSSGALFTLGTAKISEGFKNGVDFLLGSRSEPVSERPCSYSLFVEKPGKKLPHRLIKRSPFGKDKVGVS